MHIERIQIEEGFLNGFDVRPTAGLNVLIGARGTGKTSLIELIRFCLNVEGFTPDASRRSRDHALSVLGSGQVTLTLVDGERRIIVSRSANEPLPRASGPFVPPIVLSQTEIETVGLQPGGRLRLLDGFLADQRSMDAAEAEAVAAVRSLTSENAAIREEIARLNDLLAELPSIEAQLAELAPQERQLAGVSFDAQTRTDQLASLSQGISSKSVASAAIKRFHQNAEKSRASTASLYHSIEVEAWPANAGADQLADLRSLVQQAQGHLNAAYNLLGSATEHSAALDARLQSEKIGLEDQARQLRQYIESIQVGAGNIARRGQALRERKAELESLNGIMKVRTEAMVSASKRRSTALDTLETIRTARYSERARAASALNMVLGPRIRITVMRGGQTDSFSTALTEALRGSGLRYNDLVFALAQRISPRELLNAVENDDYEIVATRAGMTTDRAAKAIIALKSADLGAIATVPVEDYVTFSLHDGADYKDISELSTGQRCTVILPLVLRHIDRLLIVDQPEDHIDNAFIADTLIKSILARSTDGQLIFSTHNANIPVLGAAEIVIQMGSDGRRGFPLVAAPLSNPIVVKAITSVMEGGAEAFQRRAAFYGSPPVQ